jgi:tetratricopeptide (TPR) repeat protein
MVQSSSAVQDARARVARIEAEISDRSKYEWCDELPGTLLPAEFSETDSSVGDDNPNEPSPPLTYSQAATFLVRQHSPVGYWALGRCRIADIDCQRDTCPGQDPMALFLSAIEQRPDYALAWSSLALYTSDFEVTAPNGMDAVECCAKALALDPADAFVWARLGDEIEARQGLTGTLALSDEQIVSVKDCRLRVLQCDPSGGSSWYQLARVLERHETVIINGEPVDRDVCLRRSATLDPEDVSTWIGLAELLDQPADSLALGDETLARCECLVKALAIDREQPWAWAMLGLAAERRGPIAVKGLGCVDAERCYAYALREELRANMDVADLADGCRIVRLEQQIDGPCIIGFQGRVVSKSRGDGGDGSPEAFTVTDVRRSPDVPLWTEDAQRVRAFAKPPHFPLLPVPTAPRRPASLVAGDAEGAPSTALLGTKAIVVVITPPACVLW